jgi:hypothetical protein
MLAAGCSERCTTTGADHVASPAVAVALAGSNTVTMAAAVTAAIANTVTASITTTVATTVAATVTASITTTVAATGSSTRSSTAAPSSGSTAPSATTTVREHRSCCQGGNHHSEHEHTESCHVAPPP